MTIEEHKARHKLLHQHFDELLADYLTQNPSALPFKTSLIELAAWSKGQCDNPTEDRSRGE